MLMTYGITYGKIYDCEKAQLNEETIIYGLTLLNILEILSTMI